MGKIINFGDGAGDGALVRGGFDAGVGEAACGRDLGY